MSYRVETASSGRAGCSSTECKKAGIKIDKDDLRLGVWVPFEDRGSWKWRHWGCITGKVLQGIRNVVADPDTPGSYRWDMLDGYDSGEKNSLDKYPDLQEKVRRCITQGFIDPEDFNGDPEMNVLGAVGLRTKESKKQMREDEKARTHEINELKAEVAALRAENAALRASGASTSKLDGKTATAQADLKPQEAGETPARKKRVKDEVDDDEVSPVKKKRATKKKADHGDDEDVKPAKAAAKPRAKKVKKEEQEDGDDGTEIKSAPAKKPRAKKGVKKEEDTEMSVTARDNESAIKDEDSELPNFPEKSAPKKKRAPRGKKAVKTEPADGDAVELLDAKPSAKKARKKALKEEPIEEASNLGVTEGFSAVTDDRDEEVKGEADIDTAVLGDEMEAHDALPEIKNVAPPTKRRRTRSRTSNKA